MTTDEYFAAARERGWTAATDYDVPRLAHLVVAWQPEPADEPDSGLLKAIALRSEWTKPEPAYAEALRRIDAGEYFTYRPGREEPDWTDWLPEAATRC